MAAQRLTKRGMRFPITDGDELFAPFFDAVQDAASKQGKVFFLDAAQGREFSDADMAGDDLSGWLVPSAEADRFEIQWREGWDAIDDEFFDNCFVWAIWEKKPKGLFITFKKM